MSTWEIFYYVGGEKAGEWQRAQPVASFEAAEVKESEIERAGRPCWIISTDAFNAVGMVEGAPFWWDFARLAPKQAVT
jgi:hypothetical protein